MMRYRHHSGREVDRGELQKRYEYEIALLHVLTSVLSDDIRSVCGKQVPLWPVFEQTSPYGWYRLHHGFSTAMGALTSQFSKVKSPEMLASQISDYALVRVDRRHLGEFYTPLPIARHLVEASGFDSGGFMSGKRAVDPACGGGIILVTLANKVIVDRPQYALDPQQILHSLSLNLFGFDLQPFAIAITKTLLIYSCLPLFSESSVEIPISLFPNVRLGDALLAQQYWSNGNGFHYVIGNPPFMPVKKNYIGYIEDYQEILHGYPNLYQLFLWWAVRAAIPQEGVISFLLPQSILSGNYFSKLRSEMDKRARILSITRMIDRKGIVGDADQQMMALCLQVSEAKTARKKGVVIRVTRSGSGISEAKSYRAKYPRVVQRIGEDIVIWVVSDDALDYAIYERLLEKCTTLPDLNDFFGFGNGGYVWNQHKELIQQKQIDKSVPLVSAVSIRPFGFEFPYRGPHASRTRQFSLIDDKVQPQTHCEPALLVQRTTPRKVGRRLVAGMPTDEFFAKYPVYFLENHVNYINTTSEDGSDLLYGLMGWLNSDLINFTFQLRCGTGQVSLFELGTLPVNMEMIRHLEDKTMAIVHSADYPERTAHVQSLNDAIFGWLSLGPKHRARIKHVLSRKEQTNGQDEN
jgi:hypothetical protein